MENTESQQNFQKFVYELFEKNGILSNLRAHLRSNIVEVLRSAQSGTSLPTQKNFTQRLELHHQALNILIVEHLMSSEFHYSLSVFISEIPLANMVFDFAKSLFDGADIRQKGNTLPRFQENDIWSILNSLGVKCDSVFANNVLEMYQKDQNSSLLLCLLKYMPYDDRDKETSDANFADGQSSVVSSQSSIRNITETQDILQQRLIPPHHRETSCKHLATCNDCKKRIYKFKKKSLEKKEKGSSAMSVECFMRSVEVAERHIMEEMFEQIKVVYETEAQMYKTEEEKRLKLSLINHAKLLKQRRDEMEANFKEREAELLRNVNQKKKFLWGLATSLRSQHAQMSQAMMNVRRQTEALAEKEDNIRARLIDAEKSLKTRGEEMREQISNELQTLERHLECLKMEREKINNERMEIERLKTVCEKAEKIASQEHLKDKNSSNFEVLKNEIATLKHYLKNTKPPKCYMETATLTDDNGLTNDVLNNEQNDSNVENESRSGKLNQVVNDLKKAKNVNFCQESLSDVYRDMRTSPSSSTDAVDRLKIENEQLKTFAKQQKNQIESLVQEQAELQARVGRLSLRDNTLWRPRTAPPSLSLSANRACATFGPHKGAGEELSSCLAVQPRVYDVGQPVPFVGETKADSRRYLMSQWRKLRRISPPSPKQHRSRPTNKASTSHDHDSILLEQPYDVENHVDERSPKIRQETVQRQKSPKSILREAKEKLKNRDRVKQCSLPPRRSSPGSVLREAKLRLRKLELQAEAVEKSYLDFRRRNGRSDAKPTSSEKLNDDNKCISDANVHSKEALESMHVDYDSYLSQTKLNTGDEYFKTLNTAAQLTNPINITQTAEVKKTKENYIDIPMSDFRKLYSGLDVISNSKELSDCPKNEPSNESNLQVTDTSESDYKNPGNSETKEDSTELVNELETEKNENVIQEHHDSGQENVQGNNSKVHDLESNSSVSKDISQKTEHLKTSLSDKEMQFEILKNNINKIYNEHTKHNIQVHSEIENLPSEKQEEANSKTDDEVKSPYSEMSNINNLLRVEINSVSEAQKSIKSSKLVVVVKSTLDRSDKEENQVAIVSPTRTTYDSELSETYNDLFDKDLSVGGVKDDVLASGEGNGNSENLIIPSDCISPISDDDNFYGN